MDVEIHGYDEAIKQLEEMQYGLTEGGMNEYLSDVKKQAYEICGLKEEEITLKAVKNGDKITIDFSMKDRTKLECVKNAIEKVLPSLPITTKPLFEQMVIQIKKKIDETPAS
ncbi:MAG: hypothetical protein WA833_03475 [Nitrosotalea sp.]